MFMVKTQRHNLASPSVPYPTLSQVPSPQEGSSSSALLFSGGALTIRDGRGTSPGPAKPRAHLHRCCPWGLRS